MDSQPTIKCTACGRTLAVVIEIEEEAAFYCGRCYLDLTGQTPKGEGEK